jgi:hypothetical protein
MRRNKGRGVRGSAGMVRLRQAGVFMVKSNPYERWPSLQLASAG